ncbi:MAG: CapK related-protein [candidate division WS6 bacterium 34_10]|uniref:CapK related-protein n=1 Tax=candidate division WS6 bacterium 34_10 TaxID=1641389 RepID=A0A117M0N5_9BACT|nr:MAG: CapK related-protein [candidate division WS6 bacterium 34_10]
MVNWRKPLIYVLSFLQGSNRMKYYNQIIEYSKLSEDKLKDLQEDKLKKLLLHSYENVPYYTEVLEESGVVKKGKVYLENFKNIPILTKEILRSQKDSMLSKDYQSRKPFENTSGGSTGEPVKFIQDREYDDWNVANKMYYRYVAGQGIGEKELRFWGSERDLLEGKETLEMRFRNFIFNRKEFNTFKMSKKEMRRYVDEWNEYKPHWVESYVQSMFEFSKFINDNNLDIYSPDNGILTSAGTLIDEARSLIENVFLCDVYNRYGSREVGDMACGKDELRLSVWNHYVEIIDSKIYVTLLTNYSMPLIRYEIGDVGEFGERWDYIKAVKGRINSVLRTKSRTVDGAAVTSMFYYRKDGSLFGSFSKYQVIQESIDRIRIKVVVKDRELWEEEREEIRHLFGEVFGEDVDIEFEIVEDIEPSKSGKYLYVISKIQ